MSGQPSTQDRSVQRDLTVKNLKTGELAVKGSITQDPVVIGDGALAATDGIAIGGGANAASNYLALGGDAQLDFVANTDANTTHHLLVRVNNSANVYAIQLIDTNTLA